MKLSDGFDARRLRNREVIDWRWRAVCLAIALLVLGGLALACLGGFALLSSQSFLAELHNAPVAAASLLFFGLLIIAGSLRLNRRLRRRRYQGAGLSLAPHLLRNK